jgi:2-oxoglutarate ferredoxin oxidoreductase subunit delta
MVNIKVKKEKCKGCCLCVAECPRGAMRMSKEPNDNGNFYPVIDVDRCVGCALCCQMCPDVAIEIEE